MQTENIETETEMTVEMEDNLNGNQAGRVFAHRHIIEKINLFLGEYRRNGYTEDFISGFIDGVNDVTGGAIDLVVDTEDENGDVNV